MGEGRKGSDSEGKVRREGEGEGEEVAITVDGREVWSPLKAISDISGEVWNSLISEAINELLAMELERKMKGNEPPTTQKDWLRIVTDSRPYELKVKNYRP